MRLQAHTARRLAAARDIAAVLLFCLFAAGLWRAVSDAPSLQKERVTAREASADIDEFFRRLEKTHPGPEITPADYAALKARAQAEAAAGSDEFGRLEVSHLARAVYRAAAGLGDGATRGLWLPPRKWKDPEPRFPPFALDCAGGKFGIRTSDLPGLAGTELLEINGRPAREFLTPALELISGETREHRDYLFCLDQAAWLDISGLFAGGGRFTIKYRAKAGRPSVREVSAATAGEFRRLAWKEPIASPAYYGEKAAAWLTPAELRHSWRARRAWNRQLSELSRRGITALALDLRDCPRGDARMAAYMADSLAKPGLFRRIAVLTGPGSGSAAAWLAARLRQTGAAEIIGTETGGTAGHYGAPEGFKLPASGIRFAAATRRFEAPGGEPGPVRPDLAPPAPKPLARHRRGDPRAFILDRIAAQPPSK